MSNREKFITAIRNTWGTICYDVLEAEDELGDGTVSQDLSIKMTLDANRVNMYGGLSEGYMAEFNRLTFQERVELAKLALPEESWE